MNQLIRSHNTQIEPAALLLKEGHLGYGIAENESGEMQTIHFKTAISSSPWILGTECM
jgi:hypothetical protein